MHAEMLALMNDVLDGIAAAGAREHLEAHVADCAECAATWRALSRVHQTLSVPVVLTPPSGFTGRVMGRITAERPPARQSWLTGWVAAAVLAVAFAAALVIVLPWPDLPGADFPADSLTMFVALLEVTGTWAVLLDTFARTLAALGGDTAVSVALAASCMLMAIWIWLVSGAGSFGRRLQDPGGLQ